MAPSTFHNYYTILGVPQSANSATIKSTYRSLALSRHPDRRGNEPSATAEFQLLQEAYEHLIDVDKRREYDKIYVSTIRPREFKDQKIAELRKELQQRKNERKKSEILLNNAKKDLLRLYAEKDSLKGEKERLQKEKAERETWWLYMYSFLPGKGAEFTQLSRRQESAITTMIGKQRTKESNIDHKKEIIQTLDQCVRSILSDESKIEEKISKVEEDYRLILIREQEKILEESRKKSEQEFGARRQAQAHFTRGNSYFHRSNPWDF